MSVSTHVLDAVNGVPAAGLTVTLEALTPEQVSLEAATFETATPEGDGGGKDGDGKVTGALARAVTDDDGRIQDFHAGALPEGTYRLVFATGGWFSDRGRATFYPEVVVTFTYDGSGHVHVPVLLSPFSYTTYRGS